METDKQKEAVQIAEAWQTLYYAGLLNDKESANIWKKIKTKYAEILKLPKPVV